MKTIAPLDRRDRVRQGGCRDSAHRQPRHRRGHRRRRPGQHRAHRPRHAAAVAAQNHWGRASLAKRSRVMFSFRQLLLASTRTTWPRSSSASTARPWRRARRDRPRTGDRRVRLRHRERAQGRVHRRGRPPASTCTPSASRSASSAASRPFNFPMMVPMWMHPIAIATGNAFILKPAERDAVRADSSAELFRRPVCPTACSRSCMATRSRGRAPRPPRRRRRLLRRLHPGGQDTCSRPRIASGKRVQALGGANNHAIVMPDADLDFAAPQIVSGAFGVGRPALHGAARRRRRGGIADDLVGEGQGRTPRC